MHISVFTPHDLPELTRLINTHIRLVPPYWKMTEEQVAATIANANSLWQHHYPDTEEHIWETVCVRQDDRLLGAAQRYIIDIDNAGKMHRYTGLAWICTVPDNEQAIDFLLSYCNEQALKQGCSSIEMTSRNSFGIGWLGVPVVWPHILHGLERAGFDLFDQWVILTGKTTVDAVYSPPLGSIVEWHINESALEWDFELHLDGKMVGECDTWGIPPHFQGCLGSNEWITLEAIEVNEAYQRRGIGQYLLQEQLRFQAQRGIKQLLTITKTDNIAMKKLGEKLGFTHGPEVRRLKKKL